MELSNLYSGEILEMEGMLMANFLCPLCGEENKCKTGRGKLNNCWCDKEEFPLGIFEFVPKESRGKHCICQKCVIKYKKEKVFKNS
ncbi:cysteine-rich CWC family protein [Salipaludibacillus daqingensis]|uniref:cysteine-rich CWC family protein n=1 Tax=Salipaludibacillus daqingensis TaxID=3041001 RepID=UPI0024730340|nr:cysteine-rich CWC family protein [Salipaludibacillus daqingensis]